MFVLQDPIGFPPFVYSNAASNLDPYIIDSLSFYPIFPVPYYDVYPGVGDLEEWWFEMWPYGAYRPDPALPKMKWKAFSSEDFNATSMVV